MCRSYLVSKLKVLGFIGCTIVLHLLTCFTAAASTEAKVKSCFNLFSSQLTTDSMLSDFPHYRSGDKSLLVSDLLDPRGNILLFRHIEAVTYDPNHHQSVKNTYISYSIHPRFVLGWGKDSFPEGLVLITIQNIREQNLYYIDYADPAPIIASFDRAPLSKLTQEKNVDDLPLGEVRVKYPEENVIAIVPYSQFRAVLNKQFKKNAPIPVKQFVEELLFYFVQFRRFGPP